MQAAAFLFLVRTRYFLAKCMGEVLADSKTCQVAGMLYKQPFIDLLLQRLDKQS